MEKPPKGTFPRQPFTGLSTSSVLDYPQYSAKGPTGQARNRRIPYLPTTEERGRTRCPTALASGVSRMEVPSNEKDSLDRIVTVHSYIRYTKRRKPAIVRTRGDPREGGDGGGTGDPSTDCRKWDHPAEGTGEAQFPAWRGGDGTSLRRGRSGEPRRRPCAAGTYRDPGAGNTGQGRARQSKAGS